MQGLCSHPPAAVVPSMAAEVPLLGALVTCSKAVLTTNWSFTDLAAVIKLQLLIGCQVLELLGGMFEGLGGTGDSQQQHSGRQKQLQKLQQQGEAQYQSEEPQREQQQGQQHQQNGAQGASRDWQCEAQKQQQQFGSQRQQEQQVRRQEKGEGSEGQALKMQEGQQQEREQQQQDVVEWATKYLEWRRGKHQQQQQQEQNSQTRMQELELPDEDEWGVYSTAAEPAILVVAEAFGVAATAAEHEVSKPANGERSSAIAAAARAAAAAHLDSAPLLAAADAADRAGAAEALAAAFMETVTTAAKAVTTPSRKKQKANRKEADYRAAAFAAVKSVLSTESGLALLAAAMQTAAPSGEAAGVGAVLTAGRESAGTVAGAAGGLPKGVLEGRSQGNDLPCLKEQVEGLLWAGLFSMNCACDLLQRLSCTVADAAVVGYKLGLGQGQLIAKYQTADKVLLAAIRMAEEAWAGQPPTLAAAAARGGVLAAAGEVDPQTARVKAARGAGTGGAAADKLVIAIACARVGRETQVGAAAEGSGTCVPLMSSRAISEGLRQVPGCADVFQGRLQKGGCSWLVKASDSPLHYYSLLEQQGPWFMLQAASHVAMVRRLDWESGWVEQRDSATTSVAREPTSAGLGRQQGSTVGDGGQNAGFLDLLSLAGDVLHDAVLKLPQQLLVEGSVLAEVRRKVVGWRGDLAEPNGCNSSSREWEQQQGAGWNGGIEESYKEFAKLILVLQSCLWGMPVSFCCNNLGCRRMGGISELAQVYGDTGGGGFCQACKLACYCSAECHTAAARFHRHACKAFESKQ